MLNAKKIIERCLLLGCFQMSFLLAADAKEKRVVSEQKACIVCLARQASLVIGGCIKHRVLGHNPGRLQAALFFPDLEIVSDSDDVASISSVNTFPASDTDDVYDEVDAVIAFFNQEPD